MSIDAATVKKLRDQTGCGMMDCKKALEEAGGDIERSIDLLRKKGLETAKKRGGRETAQGLVASYIHRASPRADRPMLCLNCAALSANLLESELFGHERGAFTGADRTRKGRFELAHGGTLLLDEVSEMGLPLQSKLLRVLQENAFERVGSSTTRQVDVRVVATTNRNLEDWVARKRFRDDLYYRLNVLPVWVPPLRDRTEDVPQLVEHFLRAAGFSPRGVTDRRSVTDDGAPAQAKACGSLQVTQDAIRLLRGYCWPGNVRELENICRRAATLSTTGTMTAELIEPWLHMGGPARDEPRGSRTLEELGPLRDGRMLEDMERKLIERTLTRFSGHRAKTAKTLGMGVRTLGMKLKQWREEAAEQHRALAGAAVDA